MPRLDFSHEFLLHRHQNGVQLLKPQNNHILSSNSLGEVFKLPFNVYFTRLDSIMGKINQEQARSIECQSSDISGVSLYNFLNKATASRIQRNNDAVMQGNKTEIFDEETTNKYDTSYQGLSIKFPWFDLDNKILGIFGFAVILNKHSLAAALNKLFSLGFLNQNLFKLPGEEIKNTYLTKRENQILKYTLKGHTAKQVARIYSISPRTVEIHLVNIKSKFKVNSRSELIELFI